MYLRNAKRHSNFKEKRNEESEEIGRKILTDSTNYSVRELLKKLHYMMGAYKGGLIQLVSVSDSVHSVSFFLIGRRKQCRFGKELK